MKTIGIVRRIDELGRIVIPKEIRKTLSIKEGALLEIFTNKDTIILKKYKSMEESNDKDSIYKKKIKNKIKNIQDEINFEHSKKMIIRYAYQIKVLKEILEDEN